MNEEDQAELEWYRDRYPKLWENMQRMIAALDIERRKSADLLVENIRLRHPVPPLRKHWWQG